MRDILVVDDDSVFRTRLSKALRLRGYNVYEAEDVSKGVSLIIEHSPSLAVFDLRLPDDSGLVLVETYKETVPNGKCVVLTGYGTVSTAVTALKIGAYNYLTKPAHTDEILEAFGSEKEKMKEDVSLLPTPTLSQVERHHIQKVLDDCDGNITHASKRLGIHRRSLQRKLGKTVS